MDAFYASVEQRDHPEWRGLPVIVGSPPDRRGVVCAASYEARKFGVRSALPSATAGRLCPAGIFVRPRMEAYKAESKAVMALVREHCGDRIEQVSVDEAYVELTDRVAHIGDPDAAIEAAAPLARTLKSAIFRERGLTATVGIAANKLLAKIASDHQKPDGLTLIRETGKAAFLRPLPVRVLRGVGAVTEQTLINAGLTTVGHVQDHPGDLRALVGSWGADLRAYAFGNDSRPLELGDDIKSISSENTFLQDTDNRPTLRSCLREQADEIAGKLARRRLAAHTVQVKVRYSNFTTLTRQMSVDEPLTTPDDLYRLACWLLGHHRLVSRPLRLLGLGVTNLSDDHVRQLHLPFC
jgi:DNA polymerase IV